MITPRIRNIVSPISKAADLAYDFDLASMEDLKVLELPDETFQYLWSCGFFSRIDERCGTLIDDFEDERLESEQLLEAVNVIDEYLKDGNLNREVLNFLSRLREMFAGAQSRGTTVYIDF